MRTAEWGAGLVLDRAGVPFVGRTTPERLGYVFGDSNVGIPFDMLSSGEQTLVRVAQTIFNGGGNVTLEQIIRTLDRENLAAVIEVLFAVYVDR